MLSSSDSGVRPLVLLTGATGYIGGRLLKGLEKAGWPVRCLARHPEFLRPRVAPATEVVQGDCLNLASLQPALAGVHTAYYLVHSMGSSGKFEEEDRRAARNFAASARDAGVRRIIYLGGLGAEGQSLSAHLRSRQEVADILRSSGVPTIEFRASIVIGSGSLSFEMIRALVQRLPVMICPRWVGVKAQPIAVEDVVAYLLQALELPVGDAAVFEIGGVDQVSYGDIMQEYARQCGLRRWMIPVPVLTPRLSSLWLGLVTPIYARIGRKLVDSMRNPTLVRNPSALKVFDIRPKGLKDAIERALHNENREFAETSWSDALSSSGKTQSWGGVRFGTRLVDSRTLRVSVTHAAAFAPINRPRLLEAYVALNLREGWQLSLGKQSLSWAPGAGGSFLWSDNIEPIPMLRFTHSGTRLPGLLGVLGPVRVDSFIGRLAGHAYIPNPYVYGNKINFKPLPNLELGFGRSVTIGGKGGDPLTAKNFLLSFFGQKSSQLNSVPGDSNTSFDWIFYIPKTRNYLVFYGDWYADDDFVPFQNPPKNPYRPGIYLTRFPGLPKLDFHMEAASTESPWFRNRGNLNYWNYVYRDGYTNNGNLIGNTVGRMGRSIQCWFNYWMSPGNVLQFTYKRNTVSSDFLPGGGAWQDYSALHEIHLHSGVYVKSQLQYERISRYPLLFSGPRHNVAAVIELGWLRYRTK